MTGFRVRRLTVAAVVAVAATLGASTAQADPGFLPARPSPGMQVDDENATCTAGFAAQGSDGGYYFLTSGHCDGRDGSVWTYDGGAPLGPITASEVEGDVKDAAIIRLDPGAGQPTGDVGERYPVRDVLGLDQIRVGMPFCKIGAITGETCGQITSTEGGVVEASVFSLEGDSGSPGFVKNQDGTVSAVGLLTSSPEDDDYTSYFTPVAPVLAEWGLHIVP